MHIVTGYQEKETIHDDLLILKKKTIAKSESEEQSGMINV